MKLELEIIQALIKIREQVEEKRYAEGLISGGIGLAEVHCIDWIGQIESPNVTKVAQKMGVTRGGVSKISKKLQQKNLIESYQRAENNKEIYFRLTELGRLVFEEHEAHHLKSQQEKMNLLATYNENEQRIILRFLNEINKKYEERAESGKDNC